MSVSLPSADEIFKNNLCIPLPDSITIEQLVTNSYVSTPRNRQIAKIVKEMGLIEKYGTGIKRVRSMFVDYDLLDPKFELIPGGFAVTVYAKNENDTLNNLSSTTINVTDNVTDNTQSKRQDEVIENKNVSENVPEKRLKLLIKSIMGCYTDDNSQRY